MGGGYKRLVRKKWGHGYGRPVKGQEESMLSCCSVANRNSHADPPVSQVYEVGKVTENIS